MKNIKITDEVNSGLTDYFDTISYSQVGVLVDENTVEHCYPLVRDVLPEHTLIQIESGEVHKNLTTCTSIWNHLTNHAFDRNALLINLGGGVIGDMGGFCARTYKRGISFINIPTTLLAQVDASVGGKLGIDFNGLKNHIGLFSQPELIVVDPAFLKTLSYRELRSGFAEVIKHHLIADKVGWQLLKEKAIDDLNWTQILNHSISIKDDIVSKDPKEKGARKSLNFGHTIGHAIETYLMLSKRGILHGEAIAAGMIAESHIALKRQLISEDELNQISTYLLQLYDKLELEENDLTAIIDYTIHDKKNKDNKILASLPKGIGKIVWDIEISRDEILESLKYYQSYI